MNIIIFIGGCGVGTLVVALFFFWVLGHAINGSKEHRDRQARLNEETVRLMQERNEIGREQAKHLEIIAEGVASHRRL